MFPEFHHFPPDVSHSPFQAPSPEALAALLPQFAINGFIAQGGMGAVYSGRQNSLDRDIAIKILPREMGEDPEFRESFSSEAKAMARLNHPNLIGVFDYGDVDGMPYIVMEYVQGSSLHESAWNTAIEPIQAVAIVKGICDGLAHAHESGIVHRDIKPANVLLTLKAEPKIGDFGLAHAADSDKPGLVMGTPGYTAPEVFQDPRQAGPLADMYSVGVILHQLLTGIDPTGSMTPPTVPTGNLRLDAIWRKATNVNPALRYASVAEMGKALDAWQKSRSGVAVPSGPVGFQATRRPVPPRPVVVSHGGGGMGILVKLFIIAVLLAVVVFTYQLLQEYKQDIKGGIADVNGHQLNNPAPPVTAPPPVRNVPEVKIPPVVPVPDPDPIHIARDPISRDDDDDGVARNRFEDPEDDPVVKVTPEPEPDEPQGPGDPELRKRAVGLIEDARAQREKNYQENAKALIFQLSTRSGGLAKPEEAARIKRLQEDVVNNRVPIVDGVGGLSMELIRLFEYARDKEEEIESGYDASLARIRDAYVARLKGAADTAADEKLKQRLLSQADEATDLKAWVALLSPEPFIQRKDSTGGFAGGFAGHWNVQTDDLTQWVADEDGRVTINDGEWKGKTATWKLLEDGTLEVHWPDKARPYVLTRSGDGWVGKTSFQKPVTITPGDW
jgi:serine/threonine protein kinase